MRFLLVGNASHEAADAVILQRMRRQDRDAVQLLPCHSSLALLTLDGANAEAVILRLIGDENAAPARTSCFTVRRGRRDYSSETPLDRSLSAAGGDRICRARGG